MFFDVYEGRLSHVNFRAWPRKLQGMTKPIAVSLARDWKRENGFDWSAGLRPGVLNSGLAFEPGLETGAPA